MAVFISHSHDAQRALVLKLRDRLRLDGIEVVIDDDAMPAGPSEGWAIWGDKQIATADVLLVACTEGYGHWADGNFPSGRGLGVAAEAQAIRQKLFNNGSQNPNIRAVVFSAQDHQHIPDWLGPFHRYVVTDERDYRDLVAAIRQLTRRPSEQPKAPQSLRWADDVPDYPWLLANRRSAFLRFQEMVTGKTQRRIFLLPGDRGIGKTALVTELRTYAATHLRLRVGEASLRGCSGLDDLLDVLAGDLPDLVPARGAGRAAATIANLKKLAMPLVLFFDTYEQASTSTCDWIEARLLSKIDSLPGLVVVVGGRSVPEHRTQSWAQFAEVFALGNIASVADWLEYSQRRWGTLLSAERVETLILATEGDPAAVCAMLSKVAIRLQLEVQP